MEFLRNTNMTNGITIITPTGERPESFTRCVSFIQRFHKPEKIPVQWIIVDDSISPIRSLFVTSVQTTSVTPKHQWRPGINTLGLNILAALPRIEHDNILFIEDDDWYAPEYLMSMYHGLQTAEIVGEVPARYYHIPSRRFNLQSNYSHASLCQTGIRRSLLPKLEEICRAPQSDFIDVRLWRDNAHPLFLHTQYCVGMKGLPGRQGIGIGHKPELNPQSWMLDQNYTILQQWIGDDIKLYVNSQIWSRLQPQGASL